MKIRIRGNSVRFRLSRTEMANFAKDGVLAESTCFGDTVFHYVLRKNSTDTPGLTATFENNTITILMPEKEAEEWTSTDRIGFENTINTSAGNTLFILLEKDFQCLDHAREDQSDMYINPNKTC